MIRKMHPGGENRHMSADDRKEERGEWRRRAVRLVDDPGVLHCGEETATI